MSITVMQFATRTAQLSKCTLLVLGSLVAPLASAAGFANVPQNPGTLLSGLNAPQQGRTAIIAYHAGTLFTVPEIPASQPNSDYQVRTWDLADPAQPVELATWGVSRQPIMAHGYLKKDGYLVLGDNFDPVGPWGFRATSESTFVREDVPNLLCSGTRGCLFQPWFVGESWWSYNTIEGNGTISLNWQEFANWDHLGQTGVIGHPFLIGDLLIFASDQSRTGVATYNVSDPGNPILLDVLTDGGPGGYWPELWGGDGFLYIVFPYNDGGNGFRVVDATDPSDLKFVTDKALPGASAQYAQFQDEFAFIGDHKIDMRTFESVIDFNGANTPRTNDDGVGVDISQFALPLGNLLVTGGIGPNQGMAVWAHQAAPDTRPPEVGFHIPQANRVNYPVNMPISLLIHETIDVTTLTVGENFIVRPQGGSPIDGQITFSFNDILTFTPDEPLQDNTSYELMIPANGIADAAGNTMSPFSFTFSTGSSVGGNQAPIIESFGVSAYPVAPNTSVQLSAEVSDVDDQDLELRFDFGDGSPKTAWSAATNATHVYVQQGHYRARVQVRDAPGTVVSSTAVVTVATAPTGAPPFQSSPLSCSASERRVWTVNPDNNSVSLVHADTLELVHEVSTCDDPRSLTEVGSEVWVACRDSDQIEVLDASSGQSLSLIELSHGSGPVAIVSDSSSVYVALEGKYGLLRYDAVSRTLVDQLSLEAAPRALALTGDGSMLYATRFRSARNHAEVWEVATVNMTLEQTFRLDRFGGEENRDNTAGGRGIANYLTAAHLSPDNSTLWVTANKANDLRGILTADDLDADNTVRNLVLSIDLSSGELNHVIDIDNSDSSSALEFSPLGDYLFVALQGNNEVVVFDALDFDNSAGNGTLVTRLAVENAPQGLCIDTATNRLWSKNFLSRTLSRTNTEQLLSAGDIQISSADSIATVTLENLPASVLVGKRVFYNASDERMSSEGYISCATCHLDGGHDGRVWDFTGRGEGLRNTTTLQGRGGVGHGNVHWSANFDEIQDFEHDMRTAFGGLGFLSESDFASTNTPLGAPKAGLSAELDALSDYVSSLDASHVPRSPNRNSDGSLTAEALQGQLVFSEENCASCHAGAGLTDSTLGQETLHNVGTLRTTSGQRLGESLLGIDTPGLAGLWETAPYFHDGSAATLDAVFYSTGGVVIPGESGVVANGASIQDQYIEQNNDNTVRGSAYALINTNGGTVTYNGISANNDGLGSIDMRVSAWNNQPFTVTVNGVSATVTPEDPMNDPRWRLTNWVQLRVDNVMFDAGSSNQIVISTPNPTPYIAVDELVISTSDELTLADAHRRVLERNPSDQQALLGYLLQLEGGDVSIDSDGDGVSDSLDNCQLVANSDQRDTNNDGFGNLCDPDLNNDNIVNFLDVALFADVFLGSNADADFNGDGATNFLDYVIVSNYFLLPPGP
ncbi:MAG: Ig-like domain-containing protein [Gammaproteobacteria bacterium]